MVTHIQLQDEQILTPFEVRVVYSEKLSFVFIYFLCVVVLLLLFTLLKQSFDITANNRLASEEYDIPGGFEKLHISLVI